MSRPNTNRPHDWVNRLSEFVINSRQLPFAWGSNDCFHFAARWYDVITGRNVKEGAEDVEYDDGLGAMRLVRRFGGMLSLGTAAFGEPLAMPLFAQRGDVLLIESTVINHFEGQVFVVLDQSAMLGPGEGGMVALPFDPAVIVAAWAV